MSDIRVNQTLEVIQSIPHLPESIKKIGEMLEDENFNVPEVAKLINTSPALACRTLKITNSSFYGLRGKVTSVSKAVVILGASHVKSLALGFASFNTVKEAHPIVDNVENDFVNEESLWKHSMATAMAARELALKLNTADPEDAFTAGLLHKIGILVFLVHFPEEFKTALIKCQQEKKPLHEIEKQLFGLDHAEVGKLLCQKWQFPDSLINTIAEQHQQSPGQLPLIELVSAASTFCSVMGFGSNGSNIIDGGAITRLMKAGCTSQMLDELAETISNDLIAIGEADVLVQASTEDGLQQNKCGIDIEHNLLREAVMLRIRSQGRKYLTGHELEKAEFIITDREEASMLNSPYDCQWINVMPVTVPPNTDTSRIDLNSLGKLVRSSYSECQGVHS